MKYGSFDKRMKKYEYVTRNYLTTRTPVIIRIDGKAFHTFTKGFQKPFDVVLSNAMQMTMKYLCENIQGCVLGYTQSDEITLVLIDYKKIDSSPWFDYNIQKCASVSASMATMAFNKFFKANVDKWAEETFPTNYLGHLNREADDTLDDDLKLRDRYYTAIDKGAMFDSRAFNIPKEEVTNCILCRQNDATRNSIEMVGQAYFSHKELHKKKCNEIQDMLMLQKGINWNNYPTRYKRGSCCIRKVDETTGRNKWVIDNEIPIFKSNGRKYIDDLIYIGE
jgi:tRNA(His) 5'-end guanylyltransferase